MNRRTRLPRPVREARKLKMCRVAITRPALRKARELAFIFRTTPEAVLGLFVYLEFMSHFKRKSKKK